MNETECTSMKRSIEEGLPLLGRAMGRDSCVPGSIGSSGLGEDHFLRSQEG